MKTLLSIFVLVALAGCSRLPEGQVFDPDTGEILTYVTQEQLEAQIAKCEGLNGTLRGNRQSRGERMGEWYGLFCDFETPPTKTESTETTTEFE